MVFAFFFPPYAFIEFLGQTCENEKGRPLAVKTALFLRLTDPVPRCFPPSLPSVHLCTGVAKMPASYPPCFSEDSYFFHLSNPIHF